MLHKPWVLTTPLSYSALFSPGARALHVLINWFSLVNLSFAHWICRSPRHWTQEGRGEKFFLPTRPCVGASAPSGEVGSPSLLNPAFKLSLKPRRQKENEEPPNDSSPQTLTPPQPFKSSDPKPHTLWNRGSHWILSELNRQKWWTY